MLEGNEHTIPNNMEEFIRANNATLQVILKQQGTILTQLSNIHSMMQVLFVRNIFPDQPETQASEIKRRNALTESMVSITDRMLRVDVHQIYLQLSLEKFK